MKLSDVQAFILAQIAADPTLGPANAAIPLNLFSTQETQRAAINNLTRSVGFCIEVSTPKLSGGETINSGVSFLEAMVFVFITEDRTRTHQPSDQLLVDYVIAAINKRTVPTQHVTGSITCETFIEEGLITHGVAVSVKAESRPGTLPTITAGLVTP